MTDSRVASHRAASIGGEGVTHFAVLGWAYHSTAESAALRPGDEMRVPESSLAFIPASLRRRCSPFSRTTLAVAHAAMRGAEGASRPTVFASQHGESAVTYQLLSELGSAQPLSPMGFSLSVHNAAAGVFTIATGNKAPSTAIAAGERSFLMGLEEALLYLEPGRYDEVLLVCSDESVPDVFLHPEDPRNVPYALAVALGTGHTGQGCLISLRSAEGEVVPNGEQDTTGLPHATKFARWLMEDRGDLELTDSCGSRWLFAKRESLQHLHRGLVPGDGNL